MGAKEIYKRLFEVKKTNASALEKAANLGDKTAYRAIKRDSSSITSAVAQKIKAYYPDIRLEWLLTGEGSMFTKPYPEGEQESFSGNIDNGSLTYNQKREVDEFVVLPVYEIGAKGGTADDISDLSAMSTEFRKVPRSMFDDAEAILPVFGNSMTPAYPPGSEVAIARDLSGYFEFGDVYVIKIKNKARPLLKRIEQCDEDDCILLVSDNEMKRETGPLAGRFFYPPQKLHMSAIDEVWEVIGDCKRRKNKAIQLRQFREQQFDNSKKQP